MERRPLVEDIENYAQNIVDTVCDLLYLHSDGIPEAMDSTGRQFGNTRLLEVIGQGRSEPLKESVGILLEEIARWHGSEKPQDDISILALEVSVASGLGETHFKSLARPSGTITKTLGTVPATVYGSTSRDTSSAARPTVTAPPSTTFDQRHCQRRQL